MKLTKRQLQAIVFSSLPAKEGDIYNVPLLDGVYIERGRTVACDRYAMVVVDHPFKQTDIQFEPVAIQHESILKALDLMDALGVTEIDIVQKEGRPYFQRTEDPAIEMKAKIMECSFPKYRNVLPDKSKLKPVRLQARLLQKILDFILCNVDSINELPYLDIYVNPGDISNGTVYLESDEINGGKAQFMLMPMKQKE
mgnify:CR=1 FL=1